MAFYWVFFTSDEKLADLDWAQKVCGLDSWINWNFFEGPGTELVVVWIGLCPSLPGLFACPSYNIRLHLRIHLTSAYFYCTSFRSIYGCCTGWRPCLPADSSGSTKYCIIRAFWYSLAFKWRCVVVVFVHWTKYERNKLQSVLGTLAFIQSLYEKFEANHR